MRIGRLAESWSAVVCAALLVVDDWVGSCRPSELISVLYNDDVRVFEALYTRQYMLALFWCTHVGIIAFL